MKKIVLLILVLLIAAVAAGIAWLYVPQPPVSAHQVFLNANVLTLDEDNSVTEAVSVRGALIEAVGSNAVIQALIDDNTQVHDLQGKTLIPGFIDAHGHFPGSGLRVLSADLNSPPIGKIKNLAELQSALRQQLTGKSSGDWVLGFGYDDTLLHESRHPTRADLDAVSSTHPILILHISGHMGVANSRALELGGIDVSTPSPAGGVIVKHPVTGEPTGLLQETAALDLVARQAMDFSVLDFLEMVDDAAAEYLRQGVTTAQSGGVDGRMIQGMALFSRLGRIPQRLELWPMQHELGPRLLSGEFRPQRYETEKIHIGAVKFVTDGSIQGYTGYLARPYHTAYHGDGDYRGFPTMAEEQLAAEMLAYHQAGYQLALHGNGDAAIDAIIKGFARAQQVHPRDDARPIIIHAQMATDVQLDRMKALGMTPSFFSAHTYYWGDRHRDIFLGPERAARISPTRSAVERDLRFSVHLDTPVVPMNPLLLLWSTVNRETASGQVLGPEQRISVMQALRAMTADAAWQIGREKELGSLEPGKLADMVVLSKDPRDNPGEIRDVQVERTIIGGRQFYPGWTRRN